MYTDQLLRIKNKGATGSSREIRRDLFVRIKVKPDAGFVRKEDDLLIIQTVDLYAAVLGGTIIVKTLANSLKILMAEGTQNEKIIRVKAKRMPIYKNRESLAIFISK